MGGNEFKLHPVDRSDDALEEMIFARMMDKKMTLDGQALIEEAALLNEDAGALFPRKSADEMLLPAFSALKKRKQAEKRIGRTKSLRRVAMVVLCVMVVFASTVGTVESFRLEIFNFFIEMRERAISFFSSSDSSDGESSEAGYRLGWRPAGYFAGETVKDDNWTQITYANESGDRIVFKAAPGSLEYNMDAEDVDRVEDIKVSGYAGILTEKKGVVVITWKDEARDRVFSVRAQMDDETVLKMAESVSEEN